MENTLFITGSGKTSLKNLKEEEWVGFCQYRKFWAIDGKKITMKIWMN